MTQDQQRIAIATACGWTTKHKGLWVEKLQTYAALPDYLGDLNACHEMEKVLTVAQRVTYAFQIGVVLSGGSVGRAIPDWWFIHVATTAQRCEAFLRTLELWEEEGNTTKSASPTSPTNEQADHETAEQKLAWLTEILVTKAHDPIFADYWLRLARRNLRLGLPLTTPEPELNLATEQSSATDHFRDATKMVDQGEAQPPAKNL